MWNSSSSESKTDDSINSKGNIGSSMSSKSSDSKNGACVNSSKSCLSTTDSKISQKSRDELTSRLLGNSEEIEAVYVVSRIMDTGLLPAKLSHWAVKVQSETYLVTIELSTKNGEAVFNLRQQPPSPQVVYEFLTYYLPSENRKKRWTVESFVVPEIKGVHVDVYEMPKAIAKKLLSIAEDECSPKDMVRIKCSKKFHDIGNFIDDWSDGKNYNPVLNNCQRFAFDLYAFLIGQYYPEKIKEVEKRFQSPLDQLKVSKSTNPEKIKKAKKRPQSSNESKFSNDKIFE